MMVHIYIFFYKETNYYFYYSTDLCGSDKPSLFAGSEVEFQTQASSSFRPVAVMQDEMPWSTENNSSRCKIVSQAFSFLEMIVYLLKTLKLTHIFID